MHLIWHTFGAPAHSPLLLLHGVGAGPDAFRELPARLAARHRVLVPCFPGYGASPRQRPIDVDAQVAMLAEDLAELGVARPRVLGFSLGGYRALALALRGGSSVSRLLLVGGFAALGEAERAGLLGAAGAIRNDPSILPVAVAGMVSPAFQRARPEVIVAMQRWPVDRDVVADELEAEAVLPGLLERVAELGCPVHLRAGDADVNVSVAHARGLHARIPGSTLDVVPGAAHELFVEDQDGTAAWVERCLSP